MNAPLLTKLARDRIAELLDLEGYNPLNADDAKYIEERRDEALRLRAELDAVKRAP